MNRTSLLNAWPIAIALIALAACSPPDYGAQYRPIQDAFVAVWNGGKLEGLDAVLAPNYKRHGTGPASDDLAGFKKTVIAFRTQFPDMHVTIDDAYYAKDRAFYVWTFTGTDTGASPDALPPTGKSAKISGMSAVRYEGGKIVDEALYYDQLDLNQQLGYTLTPPG